MKNKTKNTKTITRRMKTVNIRPCLASTPDLSDVYSLNLRVKNILGEPQLRPVGAPRRLIEGDYRPLHLHRRNNRYSWLFLANGNVISVATLEDDLLLFDPALVVTLSEPPTAAISIDSRTVIIFTASTMTYLDFTARNTWDVRPDTDQLPPISIVAVDNHTFSAAAPSRTLSGGYTHWSGSLSATDASAVTADALAAYRESCAAASAAGYLVQPVIARYRLLDRWGNTIFRSSPVVVSAGGLQPYAASFATATASGGTFSNLSSFSVSVEGYRLAVAVESSLSDRWKTVIDRAVIEISPQFEPIDFSGSAVTRMENASSQSGTLRILLPGAADADAVVRREIISALERFDNLLTEVATVPRPFDDTTTPAATLIPISATAPTIRGVSSVKKSPATDPQLQLLSSPNRLGAKVAVADGDDIILANAVVTRYRGDTPFSMMTSAGGNSTWRAYVKVRLADGNVLVRSHVAPALSPGGFSPLLSYPSPDAVEMEIMVKRDGQPTVKAVLPLTPCHSAGISYYLADSISPQMFPSTEAPYIVPAETLVNVELPSVCAVAKAASPRSVTAATSLAEGEVVRITPSVRSSSIFDYARLHIYAFATSGIYTLAVNADRSRISATVIDSRPVVSPSHVAEAESIVYAFAADELVAVKGASVTTESNQLHGVAALGWCPHFDELWIATADRLIVKSRDGYYRRGLSVSHLALLSGLLFVANSRSVAIANDESESFDADVEWRIRMRRDDVVVTTFPPFIKPPRILTAAWEVSADRALALFEIGGDNGSGEPEEMLSLEIDGPIDFPVYARADVPTRLFINLLVSAATDMSFVFRGITLTFIDNGKS